MIPWGLSAGVSLADTSVSFQTQLKLPWKEPGSAQTFMNFGFSMLVTKEFEK